MGIFNKIFKDVGKGVHKFVQGGAQASRFLNNKVFGNYKKIRNFIQKTPGLREGAKVLMDAIPGSHAVKDVVDTVADNYGTVNDIAQASAQVSRDIQKGKHKNIIKNTKNIVHKVNVNKLGNLARGYASKHILPSFKKHLNKFSRSMLMPGKRI